MAPTIVARSSNPEIMPFAGEEIEGLSSVDGRVVENMSRQTQPVTVERKRSLDQVKPADDDRYKRPRVSRKHKKVGCLCLPGEFTVCSQLSCS